MSGAGARWRHTLANRKYKCHSCFCLMGTYTRCLNTNCEVYRGSLSPDKPTRHTYSGPVPRAQPQGHP